MNSILKNILAVIAGWIGGSIINMALIQTGSILVPMTQVDPNDMEALMLLMPTLDAKFFIFPFLAHALGSLVGAVIAGLIATQQNMKFSLSIGVLFLLGGIAINYLITGPLWFTLADIIIAYIPMAWIGGKIALRIKR